MLCTLLQVAPAELAIAAPFVGLPGSSGSELPRGALVLAEGACEDGSTRVELLSAPRWYGAALETPPMGARGCVAADALALPEQRFLVSEDAWPLRRGEVVALGGTCDAWTVDGAVIGRDALSTLQPLSPQTLADALRVRDAYQARFGPLNLADVPITGGEFVGLPLPRALDGAALAEELRRERLDTPERQQGAVRWYGGERDGRPTYAHFLGADTAWSDVWATPEMVLRVLDVAAGWASACPVAASEPERCLLQLGDLAWFDDVVPDPLGHRDHHAGRCVDVRLFRDDGSRYEAWWSRPDDREGVTGGYDRDLTIAFLRWVTTEQPATRALFGDPIARSAVPVVRFAPAHDEHIHLCF